jgi:hypothetical protein
MQAILWNLGTNEVEAASDPRGEGRADVWAARIPEVEKLADDKAAPTPPAATATPADAEEAVLETP